jgi:hypothetical protein
LDLSIRRVASESSAERKPFRVMTFPASDDFDWGKYIIALSVWLRFQYG